VRMVPALEQGLTVFRPVDPFDLRDVRSERIRVCHLVVDLVRADDPLGDYRGVRPDDRPPFHFNYDRVLA
jgi:hypothetical protein